VAKTESNNNFNLYIWIALLIETVVLFMIWLTNEYLATLMSGVIFVIAFGVFLVAVISEMIEKSKVKRSFFIAIAMVALIPLIIMAFFVIINGGLGWK